MKMWLLSGLMVLMSTVAFAATEVVDGIEWTYQVSNGKAQIYKGVWSSAIPSSTSGTITIPSTFGDYPVTSIGDYAFYGCSGLTSVTIPSSVTSIGNSAFQYCSELTSVTIPSSVTSIRSDVFRGCSSLTSVAIPEGVTSIGSAAFSGCSSLTSVTIPSSVTSIGSIAFVDCLSLKSVHISDVQAWCLINFSDNSSNPLHYAKEGLYLNGEKLTTVIIPEGATTTPGYAFKNCSALTSVTIPEGVTSIGSYAFYGCTGLTSVTIPEGVTSIGDYAFAYCSSLTSVTIPEGVTSIGAAAFYGCSSLTTVTIPEGVTSIGAAAFYYCSSLTSVTIPLSVTVIGENAFWGCSSLTTVTIPSSVTSIGWRAFWDCSSLTSVTFLGDVPSGVIKSSILNYVSEDLTTPEKYGASWKKCLNAWEKTKDPPQAGYLHVGEPLRPGAPVVTILSSQIREADPTILDVVYKVTSSKSTVKVRALAFQDGERSFAKVVRPETFVEGTAANIGDGIAANVEHTLSWKVASDWQTTLAKLKFEVLAVEDELLPLELVTLSAQGNQPAMQFSWNVVAKASIFDALLWLYADQDLGLTLANGTLKHGSQTLASGTAVHQTGYDALVYLYQKMGYELLQGERLEYVKRRTRLDLPGTSQRQYAVKVLSETGSSDEE